MRASYLSILAVLMLATVAAAAQSQNSAAAQQPAVSPTQLLDSWSGPFGLHSQPAPANQAFRLNLQPGTPGLNQLLGDKPRYQTPLNIAAPMIQVPLPRARFRRFSSSFFAPKLPILIAGPERCYAIRDYGFNADETRMESYSSCEPATQAGLKSIAPMARPNR